MSKNDIYTITVLEFLEKNPGTKNHSKKTLIANNIAYHAKINALPLSNKWLFINILLMCGDLGSDTITMTKRQVNDILATCEGASRSIGRLVYFQLVTCENLEVPEKNILDTEKKQVNLKARKMAAPVVIVPMYKLKLSSTKEINLKQDLVNSWQDTYPKEYLDLALKEMRNWLLANESKSPKSDWARFINGWFKRGWERHRLTIKSQPSKMTLEDFEDLMKGGL